MTTKSLNFIKMHITLCIFVWLKNETIIISYMYIYILYLKNNPQGLSWGGGGVNFMQRYPNGSP